MDETTTMGGASMDELALFTLALKPTKPSEAFDSTFSKEYGSPDLRTDFQHEITSQYPSCGKSDFPLHGTEERMRGHTNFLSKQNLSSCPRFESRLREPWRKTSRSALGSHKEIIAYLIDKKTLFQLTARTKWKGTLIFNGSEAKRYFFHNYKAAKLCALDSSPQNQK